MNGFSKDSTAFLQALAKNNDRDWFAQNKHIYEAAIKDPAKAFSQEMTQALELMTGIAHKPKIFRIYRDVRFSKDKTPYNTHQRISFIPQIGGDAPPAWFFSLEHDHLVLGAGVFGYEKHALDNWRERVAGEEGAKLTKILSDMKAKGLRISEPDLKRVPRPYEAGHPRADLLRHKGLAIWLDFPTAELAYGDNAVRKCLAEYKKLRPIFDWLMPRT